MHHVATAAGAAALPSFAPPPSNACVAVSMNVGLYFFKYLPAIVLASSSVFFVSDHIWNVAV